MNEVIAKIEPEPFIYRVDTLYWQRGDMRYAIQEYVVLHGTPPDDFMRFTAEVGASFGRAPNGDAMTATKVFNIPGDTVLDAMLHFAANIDKLRKQVARDGKNKFLQAQLLANSKSASVELGRKVRA